MSAAAESLIRALSARGVRMSAHRDKLRVEAPPGVLTPELRCALAAQKPHLLAILNTRTTVVARARIDFRLASTPGNAWATALAAPGDDLDTVIHELRARHGEDLVLGEGRR
jgi:hypothetical protein